MPHRITFHQPVRISHLCVSELSTAGCLPEMSTDPVPPSTAMPTLPAFYVMVSDTGVSSEQTAKQREHVLQGVAQMVMNMESERAFASS